MNNVNTEENGGRKKYLIPLVVLMLCAVAFTGAAYAYSSTLQVQDNEITAKSLSLDLKTGQKSTSIVPADDLVTFTDNYIYPASGSKTDAVECEVKTHLAFTCDLTVSGDATANKLNVAIANYAEFMNSSVGTMKISNLFKLYVTDNSALDASNIATSGKELTNTESVFDIAKDTADSIPATLYIWIVALDNDGAVTTSSNTFVVREKSAVAETNDQNAAYFSSLFNGYGLNLTFEAEKI